MYSDIRGFITDVVIKSTAKGLDRYPKKKEKAVEQVKALSDKALGAKKAIEEGDFGCQKESVAKLVSAILGEPIEVDCAEDDFDSGKVITVPRFSLLVCIHSTEDCEGDEIEVGEEILKIRTTGDTSDLCCTASSELLSETKYHYLAKDGMSQYLFDEICENEFRFASEDEIKKFIKKLPKDAIKFWFGTFVAIFDLALKQTDK